ncbi:MAG TPA: ComEC/Rec2 family competence protein [Anaerolineae bacterium]|nr:ComEC/Rec2 family competence protein [Anaerolineae bacterium]
MRRIPRAGWLSLGAIAAALLAEGGRFALPLPAWLGLALYALVVLAGLAAAVTRRAPAAAFLVAFGSVGLRAAAAGVLAGSVLSAPSLPVGSGEWGAQVVDVSTPAGVEQRAFVRLTSHAGSAGEGDWLVYAWLPRYPPLVPGDGILLSGTVQPPPVDAPGFAGFLEGRGAVGTLKAHTLELTASGDGFVAGIERVRWGIDSALSRAVPEPEAGLASGILIGLRERVSRAVADDFTTTGLTHVVAISGWNIALVAGIATALLRALGLSRRVRSAIVIVAIVAYTVLAGAEASVIRAAVMGGVVIVARESGRPSGAVAALGLACWGLLLVEPRMIDDIGLQLSLAATAGLLALGGQAEAAVGRLFRGRAPRWLQETLGVSLAAQLATLPLILLHFGRLSLISPLANLAVAPIVPLAMLGAAVGVLLGPLLVVPSAGLLLAPLLLGAWLPLSLMTRGASLLADVPGANVELGAPFDLLGAGLATVALAAALRVAQRAREGRLVAAPERPPAAGSSAGSGQPAAGRRRRLAGAACALLLAAAVSVVLIARPLPGLQVSVLDVGQGDAILLQASDGSRMLVDGGSDPDLLVRRLDERIPVWDRAIDMVVLTHPHDDHAGGLAGLAPRYHVDRIIETGMPSAGSGVRGMRASAIRHGIRRVRLVQGDAVPLGAARIDVLWPPRTAIPERELTDGRAINDTSIVLSVALGQQRVLLTGDLEDDRDADILEVIPREGRRWDLLKVAHHGSATASSRELLEVLRPRLAAISVGSDNRHGHPAAATLQRLQDVGARVWRTDLQGTLTIDLDGRPRSATALLAGPAKPLPCAPSPARAPTLATAPHDACYARPDGSTHSHRSPISAPVYLALATPAAARDRRGRGGFVPRLPRCRRRHHRRSTPGRDSRAPP